MQNDCDRACKWFQQKFLTAQWGKSVETISNIPIFLTVLAISQKSTLLSIKVAEEYGNTNSREVPMNNFSSNISTMVLKNP